MRGKGHRSTRVKYATGDRAGDTALTWQDLTRSIYAGCAPTRVCTGAERVGALARVGPGEGAKFDWHRRFSISVGYARELA